MVVDKAAVGRLNCINKLYLKVAGTTNLGTFYECREVVLVAGNRLAALKKVPFRMPDGTFFSEIAAHRDQPDPAAYVPPVNIVFQGLNITEMDLQRDQVTVQAAFLKFLIGELARLADFDSDYYASSNPDVEAARLAGDIASLHAHFVEQGYFERRQPAEMAFEVDYYRSTYTDLATAFQGAEPRVLNEHFHRHGWQEGRVGTQTQRDAADRWVAAARQIAPPPGLREPAFQPHACPAENV